MTEITPLMLLAGVYLVGFVAITIISIIMYIEEGDQWPFKDRLGVLGVTLVWPLALAGGGIYFAAKHFLKVKGLWRRKISGRYWTIRARIAREDEPVIWHR